MFDGPPEQFQHTLLRMKDDDVEALHKYVDYLGGPDLVEILLHEISRRKIDVGYGLTLKGTFDELIEFQERFCK